MVIVNFAITLVVLVVILVALLYVTCTIAHIHLMIIGGKDPENTCWIFYLALFGAISVIIQLIKAGYL